MSPIVRDKIIIAYFFDRQGEQPTLKEWVFKLVTLTQLPKWLKSEAEIWVSNWSDSGTHMGITMSGRELGATSKLKIKKMPPKIFSSKNESDIAYKWSLISFSQ